jgi:hypothetical protein
VKKISVFVLIIFAFLFAVLTYYKNSRGLYTVSISVKNCENVYLSHIKQSAEDVIYKSADCVFSKSLLPYNTYQIEFVGNDGYGSGKETFIVDQQGKNIEISPGLSKSKILEISQKEKVNINKSTSAFIVGNPGYSVSSVSVLGDGSWAVAIISYMDKSQFGADDLRLLLIKDSGVWRVTSASPSLVLSKKEYQSVPVSILEQANAFSLNSL